jgi:hypothetical protein
MFHQQAVDEDVSTSHAAEEDQVNAVVEKGDKFPGEKIVDFYHETQNVVLNKRQTSIE